MIIVLIKPTGKKPHRIVHTFMLFWLHSINVKGGSLNNALGYSNMYDDEEYNGYVDPDYLARYRANGNKPPENNTQSSGNNSSPSSSKSSGSSGSSGGSKPSGNISSPGNTKPSGNNSSANSSGSSGNSSSGSFYGDYENNRNNTVNGNGITNTPLASARASISQSPGSSGGSGSSGSSKPSGNNSSINSSGSSGNSSSGSFYGNYLNNRNNAASGNRGLLTGMSTGNSAGTAISPLASARSNIGASKTTPTQKNDPGYYLGKLSTSPVVSKIFGSMSRVLANRIISSATAPEQNNNNFIYTGFNQNNNRGFLNNYYYDMINKKPPANNSGNAAASEPQPYDDYNPLPSQEFIDRYWLEHNLGTAPDFGNGTKDYYAKKAAENELPYWDPNYKGYITARQKQEAALINNLSPKDRQIWDYLYELQKTAVREGTADLLIASLDRMKSPYEYQSVEEFTNELSKNSLHVLGEAGAEAAETQAMGLFLWGLGNGWNLTADIGPVVKDAYREPAYGTGSKNTTAKGTGNLTNVTKTRVGQWMSKAEYEQFVKTGEIPRTNVLTKGMDGYIKQANKGDFYVEFDINSSLLAPKNEALGWSLIKSKNQMYIKLYQNQGLTLPDPIGTNITHVGTK